MAGPDNKPLERDFRGLEELDTGLSDQRMRADPTMIANPQRADRAFGKNKASAALRRRPRALFECQP